MAMPIRLAATQFSEVGMPLLVGTVTAVTAAAAEWRSLMFSALAVASSVMVTGLLNNWINRRSLAKQDGKTDAEINKTLAETLSIDLENAIKLSRHKDDQIDRLVKTVDDLKKEIDLLTEEIAELKAENVKLHQWIRDNTDTKLENSSSQ